MAESPGSDPTSRAPRRRRSSAPGRRRGSRTHRRTPPGFQERLRQDRILFGLCLGFLAFTTWALAITWKLVGDPVLLALTILSILPAFYLFYVRDRPTA